MRGNSSWPLTALTRDQPPLIGLVGAPSTALNRALSCQFSSAVAVATSCALTSSKTWPARRRSSTSVSACGSSGPSSAARIAHTCRPSASRPRKTAFSGGLSPSLAALPSTTWPPEISTWLRRSTRSSSASAQPADRRRRRRCAARRRGRRRRGTAAGRCAAEILPARSSLGVRAADVEQPVTELQGVDLGVVDAQQLAVADDAEHDVGQVPRRAADLLGRDLPFGDARTRRRGSAGLPSSRQRWGSAPLCPAAGPRSRT